MLSRMLIERTVSKLPEKHRGAIRWYYVSGHNPQGMARSVGASCSGLLELGGSRWVKRLIDEELGKTPIHVTKE